VTQDVDTSVARIPTWIKVLGWLNLAGIVVWIVLLVSVSVVGSASSSGINYSAAAVSVLLVAPVIVVARFPIVVGILIVLLVAAGVAAVLGWRRRMGLARAVWGYLLVAWSVFWVMMWIGTAGLVVGGLSG
jgi:hypothetical protein